MHNGVEQGIEEKDPTLAEKCYIDQLEMELEEATVKKEFEALLELTKVL